MDKIVHFIDLEVSKNTKKVLDVGLITTNNIQYHGIDSATIRNSLLDCQFLCGHNIVDFDLSYCKKYIASNSYSVIDTLYLSPLLFPKNPYHKLLKDDKLDTGSVNNPLIDAKKARDLFIEEKQEYDVLSPDLKRIYYYLLREDPHFTGFFNYVGRPLLVISIISLIKRIFQGLICSNSDINKLVNEYPVELAYSLAIINTKDSHSITPAWVLKHYPKIETVMDILCNRACHKNCEYCRNHFDAKYNLKSFFGYDDFRLFDGEPLQQNAVEAAIEKKSIITIFPTGGGKSLTFQLPALMAGANKKALTVVISPLQSLMKDQVDNLESKGIEGAVTINGLLSPIERGEAYERVANGLATLLYISPEALRSVTIENLLMNRIVDRFVIDEAHCFSSWGHDFRVDYLFIGQFIRELQERKGLEQPIPVSCFTATAKKKVISDIKDYFKKELNIEMDLFATASTRKNLTYSVQFKETDDDKYNTLRELIESKKCPTIVYCSRVATTNALAERLRNDGFSALSYNGRMLVNNKIENQEAFIRGDIQIMVATSAFGMGVDKSDVKLVVHYEISDSLENYVQEAGRAGRDQRIDAECVILFNEKDLDKHFNMLNRSKLTMSEIQQVFKAIKDLTKYRNTINLSPLELARAAGWNDDGNNDVETRVKTAVNALENAGYISRGKNHPRVFADSITVKTVMDANDIIDKTNKIELNNKIYAKRIISSLISSKSRSNAGNEEAQSRIDYLADTLGIEKQKVIDTINQMVEAKILADHKDLTAYIRKGESESKSSSVLSKFTKLEAFMIESISEEEMIIDYKELNDRATSAGITNSNIKSIKTILFYWTIKNYITKTTGANETKTRIKLLIGKSQLLEESKKRATICSYILEKLFSNVENKLKEKDEVLVDFSIQELKEYCNNTLFAEDLNPTIKEIENALLYLSKIYAITLDGGFFVLYNTMSITKLTKNSIKFKKEDYKELENYYALKIQQIHIVGEYARIMARDYEEALLFVQDYFTLEYKAFIAKYFMGDRAGEINRNITPESYDRYFKGLSDMQNKIIDSKSQYISVIAGPGSGKTKVLVHKLASLLLLEDIKQESLLMLTFSRAAATEFKRRLIDLIGTAGYYVDVKTFHSYCFDLLGKYGDIDASADIVKDTTKMIVEGEIEQSLITKSVLVIDEAQDMSIDEYQLLQALIEKNEDMRVIAVGDDDQNIFKFRGSDSVYLKQFTEQFNAEKLELLTNYRSDKSIVDFSNDYAKTIENRIKEGSTISNSEKNGEVTLTKYDSGNLVTAVFEEIKALKNRKNIAVLAYTNKDNLIISGLLTSAGIPCKLISNQNDISVFNMMEIRMFLKKLDPENTLKIISEENWNKAKEEIYKLYSKDENLYLIKNILKSFEAVNNKKYMSDFLSFIKESNISDFICDEDDYITVSTLHKSKGREFREVFLLLGKDGLDNEARKAIYVGITRAKEKLHILYNGSHFDTFRNNKWIKYSRDKKQYNQPNYLDLEFGYRDVNLGFFKGKKEKILSLIPSDSLRFNGEYFTAIFDKKEVPVLKISKAKLNDINKLFEQGYQINYARVKYIVAWKDPEEISGEYYAVILPEVSLAKKKENEKVLMQFTV